MNNELSVKDPLIERPALSPVKRALLKQRLLRKQESEATGQQTIPRRVSRDTVPLSFAQQRLWFLQQLEPDNPFYNVTKVIRLSGTLKVEALQQALNAIVARHEVLRTTFISVDGNPKPLIAENRMVELPVRVVEEAQVQHLMNEESQRPFNLSSDLMLRTTLLQLEPTEHLLLLVIHHIASDGWSMGILFRELSLLYEAFANDQPFPLLPLPIQYADFAHWQRQWLTGEVLEQQLNYWKQQLAAVPPLKLPTDHPRPAVQSYQGAKHSLKLSPTLTQALKHLSHQENVTLFMTLLTAFKILLSRHSGQNDIVVGTPIAARNRIELEGIIGIFLNNLVLRTDLSGHPSFQTLLHQFRKVFFEAHAHQDLPFEKIVEELQPERDLSRHPLFEVMFNFINTPQTDLKLAGLTLHHLELAEPYSKFLLSLYVRERDSELHLDLVYQKEIFSPERMVSFLNQYQLLLEQTVANPESAISSYSLVTPTDRSLLPDPTVEIPEPQYDMVTHLFLTWANRTPSQAAVSQGSQTWTYRELAEKSRVLAQVLQAHDLKPGEVVAVTGSRSFGLIASLMGIWLSGGVLLTLEPRFPRERQQLMLREANAKRLLYLGEILPEHEWLTEESLLIININPNTGQTLPSKTDYLPRTEPLPVLNPDDAAYIFFTSGTTGVPKGVLGCHKGLAHFLNWQRQTFAVGPSDRCAQLTGLSFDVVLRDIFLPLTSGATLCLPMEGDELDLLAWLEREQISLLHTVPSLAQSWLMRKPLGISLRHLRRIFFAGEPLQDKLVRRWRETFPQIGEMINLYGPTETTLAKCYYRIPTGILPNVLPVGWPLPETQALVLAENNKRCGVGERGEIVLRTPFRSLGYINAPEENRRLFIKNPFRDDESDLLFYTGDAGRYRPDGSLEILGRFDNQVKIRGIRLELEEIEVLLSQHLAVQETVVVTQEGDDLNDKRLVAYVVAKPEYPLTIEELRRFIRSKVPEYMLPSALVLLEALPLTPNGKVDRRALPVPNQVRSEPDETFATPRNDLERQLARIWEKLLKVQPIGIHDNFFDLGGHSLLVITLLDRIEKNLGKGLSVRAFFQAPTIAQLADILREDVPASWRALEAIQPQGTRPPLFFIGSTNYARALTRVLETNQPVYGLNLFGLQPSNGTTASLTVEGMARQYIQDIQTVQPQGHYCLCAYCGDAKVAFEMAQQLRAQGQQIALLAFIDVIWQKQQNRYYRHWYNLLRFGPEYLSHKIKGRLKFTKSLLELSLSKLRARWHRQKNVPLPLKLQHLMLINEFYKALGNYVPKPYPGKITLFLSDDWRSQHSTRLNELAIDGVDIYEIPGYHDSLFDSPQVEILGEQLKKCLETAQGV